jgi:hypothetical protein
MGLTYVIVSYEMEAHGTISFLNVSNKVFCCFYAREIYRVVLEQKPYNGSEIMSVANGKKFLKRLLLLNIV